MDLSEDYKEVIFIGLNPSLSNERFTDNTTRKIIKISRSHEYGKVRIINLFGLISKSPKLLSSHNDPIGYLNNKIINKNLKYWSKSINCHLWIGWGNNGNFLERNKYLLRRIRSYLSIKNENFKNSVGPLYIKMTKDFNPMHPLYCSNNTLLKEFTFPKINNKK